MRFRELVESNAALASLVAHDQSERRRYQQFVQTKAGGDWQQGAKLYAQALGRQLDDLFNERSNMNKFINMKFDFNTFTEDDWQNYWLLAQHADFNRNFQQQALGIIAQHLGNDSTQYKYLYDRISCGTNGTQKYGTQDTCEID